MANISQSANYKELLNGQELFPSINWQDVSILASFQEGDTQPTISTTDFEFVLSSYTELKQWIADGKIFEGVPFQINIESTAINTLPNNNVFDGYIDLRQAIINDTEGILNTSIRYKDDVTSIGLRLQALDYGFLYEKGVFTENDFTDLDYVVVTLTPVQEFLLLSITLYAMVTQLLEVVRLLADNAATIAGLASTSATGTIGATIYAISTAVANLAFATALTIQIIKLGRDLVNLFFPPKRTHKSISYRKMIEKVVNYLGYSFETSISELDRYFYLASNQNYDSFTDNGLFDRVGTIENGLPSVLDAGYICSDFFQIIRDMFNARFAVEGDTLHLHSEFNDYWVRNSTYEMPSILDFPYKYNTNELNSNVFVAFSTDITDGYTVQNFTGTNYQVITEVTAISDPKSVVLEGLKEIAFPFALATRKDSLSVVEKIVKVVAGAIDFLINAVVATFGGRRSNLAGSIQDRIGIMKIEVNNHNVPKVVYLDNAGKIPSNHRDLLSAKYLYDNYINELSFLSYDSRRQRRLYEGVEIPFGWRDFQKLIKNSYFVTNNGMRGKFTQIEWTIGQDIATVSYYLEEVYTRNLEETFIEP